MVSFEEEALLGGCHATSVTIAPAGNVVGQAVRRVSMQVEPSFTGLNAFQADTMTSLVLEYVAHSGGTDIRRFATAAGNAARVMRRGGVRGILETVRTRNG